jgi:hypothetical protein
MVRRLSRCASLLSSLGVCEKASDVSGVSRDKPGSRGRGPLPHEGRPDQPAVGIVCLKKRGNAVDAGDARAGPRTGQRDHPSHG